MYCVHRAQTLEISVLSNAYKCYPLGLLYLILLGVVCTSKFLYKNQSINQHYNFSKNTNFIGDPLNFPGTHSNYHLWVPGTHYIENLSTSLMGIIVNMTAESTDGTHFVCLCFRIICKTRASGGEKMGQVSVEVSGRESGLSSQIFSYQVMSQPT